jgi:hypothetical protein
MGAKKDVLTDTVTLTNTMQWPFNDSEETVALAASRDEEHYVVQAELVHAHGDIGDIVVYGKAANGFKIAFTGAASQAVIRYTVTGGLR